MPTAFRLSSADLLELLQDIDQADLAALLVGSQYAFWASTPLIDFLAAPPVDYALSIPVLSGRFVSVFASRIRVLSKVGVATGAGAYSVGNDAGVFTNLLPAGANGLTVAAINTLPAANGVLVGTGPVLTVDMANAAKVRVSTAPTGVTTLTGYVEWLCGWYP